jgi:hypothetical protein
MGEPEVPVFWLLKLGLPEEHVVSRRVAAVLLYLAAERG